MAVYDLDRRCTGLGVPIVRGGARDQPLGLWHDLDIYRTYREAYALVHNPNAKSKADIPQWAADLVGQVIDAQVEIATAQALRAWQAG